MSNRSKDEIDLILTQTHDKTSGELLPSACFLIILATVGFVGNSVTLYIFIRRMSRNFQNDLLIFLTAMSLWASVLCVPFDVIDIFTIFVYPSAVLCKIGRFSNTTSTGAQCFTLIVLAVVRYRAVCKAKPPKVKAIYVILGIIFATISLSWTGAVVFGYRSVPLINHGDIIGKECSVDDQVSGTLWPFIFYTILGTVFFSLVVITAFCYFQIWKAVRSSRMRVAEHGRADRGIEEADLSSQSRSRSEAKLKPNIFVVTSQKSYNSESDQFDSGTDNGNVVTSGEGLHTAVTEEQTLKNTSGKGQGLKITMNAGGELFQNDSELHPHDLNVVLERDNTNSEQNKQNNPHDFPEIPNSRENRLNTSDNNKPEPSQKSHFAENSSASTHNQDKDTCIRKTDYISNSSKFGPDHGYNETSPGKFVSKTENLYFRLECSQPNTTTDNDASTALLTAPSNVAHSDGPASQSTTSTEIILFPDMSGQETSTDEQENNHTIQQMSYLGSEGLIKATSSQSNSMLSATDTQTVVLQKDQTEKPLQILRKPNSENLHVNPSARSSKDSRYDYVSSASESTNLNQTLSTNTTSVNGSLIPRKDLKIKTEPNNKASGQSQNTLINNHFLTVQPPSNRNSTLTSFSSSLEITKSSDVKKHERKNRRSRNKSFRKRRSAESAISMTAFLLTFTFVVSYTPYFLVVIPRTITKDADYPDDPLLFNLINIAVRFYFVTPAINPFIFLVSNLEYRRQLRALLSYCGCR